MADEDLLAGIRAAASGGSGSAGSANRASGRYYGVPDDYVSPSAQVPFQRNLPRYTTESDDDRRILLGLPSEVLAQVQAELRRTGLISNAGYRNGVVDEQTRKGFAELLGFANQQNLDWRQALVQYGEAQQAGVLDSGAAGASAQRRTAQFDTRLDVYQRSDPARIRLSAEAAFAEALGRKPKPDELARFVKRFQNSELNAERQVGAARDANTLDGLQRQQAGFDAEYAAATGTSDGGLDAFMSALSGQESGGVATARNGRTGAYGLFQIMPSNWAPWAQEAGLPANAPRTPENQNLVARNKLQSYYDQFGSWDAVAVAWYAGPGAVKGFLENPSAARYTRKQGKGNEPSIAEYVAQVRGRMGSAGQVSPMQSAQGVDPTRMTREQELNARVAALMADAPGKVTVGSGRRTRAQQQALYDRYLAGRGPKAAKPGSSNHETGEANDLSYENAATREWVLQNAHSYGLVFPVSGENWHVEVARGQKARFGPKTGVRLGSTPLPSNAPQPVSAAPSGDGLFAGQAISTSTSVTQPDVAAQATEYARNVNPTETQAYDIGGQFNNFVALLNRGVGV